MARRKKPIVKEVKKDNTISMIILGVVAVLAIVGLVLLFSAAKSSGMVNVDSGRYYVEDYAGAKTYGGDKSKNEGSLVHQNIRGVPATICPKGSTECHIEYLMTATRRGIQDVDYNHIPAWLAYNEEIKEGRNRGFIRSCGDKAIRYSYPQAAYYMAKTNLKCDESLGQDTAGICCFMKEDTMKVAP